MVYEDNQAVLAQLNRRDLTARARHIRIAIAFVLDAVDAREIIVEYVSSQDQVADVLVAAEDRERFQRNAAILLGAPG